MTTKKKDEKELDANLVATSAEAFIEYYNDNIPAAFPKVTVATLGEFQNRYPALFKESGAWVIDKHRKKLMDWLVSHREV